MAAFVVHAIVKQAITFATRYVGDDEDLMDEQIDNFKFYPVARLTAFAKYSFIRQSVINLLRRSNDQIYRAVFYKIAI